MGFNRNEVEIIATTANEEAAGKQDETATLTLLGALTTTAFGRSLLTLATAAALLSLARPTVVSAAASVSPAASASGTYYRLSNASPTLNLPAGAGCVVNSTVFWAQGVGGNLYVTPNGTDVIEGVMVDASGTFTSYSSTGPISDFILQYQLAEFRYVATGKWALIGAFVYTP